MSPHDAADTVTVLWEAAPGDVDPRFALSAYSGKISRLVFSRLVSIDNEASEPRLDLAVSLERPDPTTYVFTLSPDATFHDGRPVTARDVVWTYESTLDPAVGSPFAGMFEAIGSVEARDPMTVVFRLREPFAPLLANLELGIVPEHLTRKTGRFAGPPVGSGPFRWASRDGDSSVTLEAHAGWHGDGPHVRRVAFRTLGDENSRVLALMGGSGDVLQNGVSPMLLPALRERPGLRVLTGPSVACSYLGFHLEDPALRDVRVRRAIAHAIDRQAIIDAKYRGGARLATGLLAPGHWAHEGDVASYAYSPARARALLDEAGFVDPPGPTPRLRLTYKTTTNRFRRAIAFVIAHHLRQVGIEVEVLAYEWGTFFHDVRSGNFQLYSLQWPVVVEPDLYHWIFHSSSIPTPDNRGKGANRGRYRSPRADALLLAGRREMDRARRRAIYGELQRLLATDLPYVPLWHDDNIALLSDRLSGWRVLPNARFAALSDVQKEAR